MKTHTSTIRGQLLLWFVTSTIITFTLLGLLVSWLMWSVLHDQIDHHLHTVITEANQVIESYPASNQHDLLQSFATQQGMTVAVFDHRGQALVQTNSPDVAKLSEPMIQQLMQKTPPQSGVPIHFTVNDIRFATLPVSLPEGRGFLAIGYSLRIVEQTFTRLISIVALVLVMALGLVIYGIRTRLSQYLTPLEEIALETHRITHTQNLSYRIPAAQPTAELRSLTSGINHMLERLESFFKTEHEFFSDAAHTLKTPLAIVRSYLETTPKSKGQQESLRVLDSANETIQDLILLSRMQSDEPVQSSVISLSKMINHLAEIIEVMAAEKGITVTTAVAKQVMVKANEKLLKRAISNIAFNAVSYTKKGGTITLKLVVKNREAILTITDTGIGIPENAQTKLFNRFYRATNATDNHGSGLGLAITKAIVEAVEGSISLKSRLGHGTQVEIRLPAYFSEGITIQQMM